MNTNISLSQHNKNAGFTIIEGILVLVIIAVLGAVVAFSYAGVRSRDRDVTRQDDISSIQGDLEIFYAENSYYPTLAQLNDSDWRQKNLPELQQETIKNPGWREDTACTSNTQPQFVSTLTEDCYAYQPTAADGETCDNQDKPCAHYTLSTPLETGEEYIKTSLN